MLKPSFFVVLVFLIQDYSKTHTAIFLMAWPPL